ncbi:MAG: dihydrolipoamide acetyltransferase family protein, partial [Bacteroidia bacterium]
MAEVINMPKMSDTMTEGVIVSWLKNVGDDIKPGDILAEVETDKATMELENFVKGTLLHIGIPAGGSVPVDALIAIVGQKGEDISALLNAPAASAPAEPKQEAKEEVATAEVATVAASEPSNVGSDSRIKASPLAKSLAKEKGIDLTAVAGSGDNGRIVKKDIENYTPAAKASTNSVSLPQIVAQESHTEVAVSQMRKVIARRLSESKHTAPHFYLTMSINMDKTIAARKQMNEYSDVKISVNDIIVKAVALSLRKNPAANSSWLGDKIRYNNHIH